MAVTYFDRPADFETTTVSEHLIKLHENGDCYDLL
jgi:hypothetical protein